MRVRCVRKSFGPTKEQATNKPTDEEGDSSSGIYFMLQPFPGLLLDMAQGFTFEIYLHMIFLYKHSPTVIRHDSQIFCVKFLALTGALIVIVCYYINIYILEV